MPLADAWLIETLALVLTALARVRFDDKRRAHGLTPKDAHATKLQNDALIARAAYLKGFSVVTENVDDFQKLQRFLKFDLVPAKDYFGL